MIYRLIYRLYIYSSSSPEGSVRLRDAFTSNMIRIWVQSQLDVRGTRFSADGSETLLRVESFDFLCLMWHKDPETEWRVITESHFGARMWWQLYWSLREIHGEGGRLKPNISTSRDWLGGQPPTLLSTRCSFLEFVLHLVTILSAPSIIGGQSELLTSSLMFVPLCSGGLSSSEVVEMLGFSTFLYVLLVLKRDSETWWPLIDLEVDMKQWKSVKSDVLRELNWL